MTPCIVVESKLKIEASCFSEPSVNFCQNTLDHFPKDGNYLPKTSTAGNFRIICSLAVICQKQ